MSEIKLSAKALAEFAIEGPTKKEKVVRVLRNPAALESKIITSYYNAAVNIIRHYHVGGNDAAYLKRELKRLREKALTASTPQARAQAANNIAAVLAYMKRYGSRSMRVVARPRIRYQHGRVSVSGLPDIAVREGNRLRLLKLGTKKRKTDGRIIDFVLQTILLAAQAKGLDVREKDVLFLDVKTEVEAHALASPDMSRSVDLACEELERMCS